MPTFGDIEVNYCPLCGEPIGEGEGQALANGAVCPKCVELFRSKSTADMEQMTVRDVRFIIDGGWAPVVVNETCPVCGQPMGENTKKIADAVICADCEHMERSMYYKSYRYYDLKGKELYDVDVEILKRQGRDDEYRVETVDELDNVTLNYVQEDFVLNKQRLQDAINDAPSHASAVAYIDESFTDGKKTVALVGVARGEFHEGDEVILVHEGELASSEIIIIHAANGVSYDDCKNEVIGSSIGVGEFGWIVFKNIDPVYSLTDIIYIL